MTPGDGVTLGDEVARQVTAQGTREARVLPSGATLVTEVRPDAASAAAGWFVNVGSRDEPASHAGISHALEHLAFKGTDDWDAYELNQRLDALGARSNAYTGEDRTAYYGSVLPEHLPALNELLAALLRPALREDDVALERSVILEEIAMADDDPESRAADLVAAAAFGEHPLGRPILGTRDSVAALTAADLRAWHAATYRPDRLVIVLSGRVDVDAEAERVDALVRRLTEMAPPLGEDPPVPVGRASPLWRPGTARHGDRRVRRAYGALLAPGLPQDDPRRIAATLLAQVLGEPGHGRLHWALVDEGLADQAGLLHEAGDGFGTYGGWFETRARDETRVRELFVRTLREAQDAPLDPDAWASAARTLATDVALQAETPYGRLMALGDAWIERGELHDPADEVARILATPPEAGQALLDERPFDQATWVTLGPLLGTEARSGTETDRVDAHPLRVP
ncbi:MAG: pitrilysin family protein [Trueperaceae bacterium]|nr:pitrilysin family protein [Trueperaceae bacterium]